MKSETEIRDNLRWLKERYVVIGDPVERKEISAKVDALEWVLGEI